MDNIKWLLDLIELQEIIKKNRTGSADKLAKTMRTNKRTIYRRLETLRSLGADIKYDPIQCTYYFANQVTISLTIDKKEPIKEN